MNKELRPYCFGAGLQDGEQCEICGQRVACVNKEAGWGAGSFLQSFEAFNTLYVQLTSGFSNDELEALDELLEIGGYIPSTEMDWIEVRGVLPTKATLEAEKNMARKMVEEFERLRLAFPRSYRVYCQLLGSIEPNIDSN